MSEEQEAQKDVQSDTEKQTEDEEVIDLTVEEADREELVERIEDLEGKLVDLSARVAHNGGLGVCPEDGCNGVVVRTSRLIRSDEIKCERCGRTVHEY